MDALMRAGIFLLSALFELYLFVLAIRMILVYTQVNYFNPFTQFIVKITKPLVNPLRKLLPTVKHIELASLFWIILLEFLKLFILSLLAYGFLDSFGFIYAALASTLKLFLNVFFYAILIQALLSFVQPYSPARDILSRITAPVLRPFQRVIPPVGGFDISPIPALLILQAFIILLS